MTKSEARAISEGAIRAIRTLNGVNLLPIGLDPSQLGELTKQFQAAHDEIQRIYDMANAELGTNKK